MPLHPEAVPEFHFISPCSAIPDKAVPAGDAWLHEVKFDGYRVQAHKVGSRVIMYSHNGHDFSDRFPSIAQLLHDLPAKAAVLDGEVVASDADGRPNFARLHVRWTRPGTIHLWAFDLLAFNGRDLRPQPLVKRQACLQAPPERFGCPAISLSEPFEDGLALLRVAEQRGLEGVVSKRRDAPYRSGECRDWSGADLRHCTFASPVLVRSTRDFCRGHAGRGHAPSVPRTDLSRRSNLNLAMNFIQSPHLRGRAVMVGWSDQGILVQPNSRNTLRSAST
jgi:hypothetical protein